MARIPAEADVWAHATHGAIQINTARKERTITFDLRLVADALDPIPMWRETRLPERYARRRSGPPQMSAATLASTPTLTATTIAQVRLTDLPRSRHHND